MQAYSVDGCRNVSFFSICCGIAACCTRCRMFPLCPPFPCGVTFSKTPESGKAPACLCSTMERSEREISRVIYSADIPPFLQTAKGAMAKGVGAREPIDRIGFRLTSLGHRPLSLPGGT